VQRLNRTIGLTGAVFIIIGYVIGASIFILPGTVAAQVGPSAYIVYLLAAIPSVFTCFVMAQIGSCFPRSGAILILLRDVLSPTFAFFYILIMATLGGVVIALVAYGFVDYLGHFVAIGNEKLMSVGIIVLFTLVNISGMNIANKIQTLMTFIFLIALIIFGVGGELNPSPVENATLFPTGMSVVGLGIVTAYFSYTGLFVIAEIAGEIKEPSKTIPLAILIAFIVVLSIYALIPYTLTQTLDWRSLSQNDIPVVSAAKQFLPEYLVTFIALSALFAAATSINGVLMGISRDVYKAARSKVFFTFFEKIELGKNTPIRAIMLTGGFAIVGAVLGSDIGQFAQLAVTGLVLIQIVTGVALLKLPNTLPNIFAESKFKLSPLTLKTICFGYIFFSTIIFIFLAYQNPSSIMWGVLYLALGFIIYRSGGIIKK